MIIKNPKERDELDKVPNQDENGEPIYKIDIDDQADTAPKIGDLSNAADDSEFKNTPQDLKDTTSQE